MRNRLEWAIVSLAIGMLHGCDKPDGGERAPSSQAAPPAATDGPTTSDQPAASMPVPLEDGVAYLSAANTIVEFTGSKTDGTQHRGGFAALNGQVVVDLDTGACQSIWVEVDTTSLWSDNPRLTRHLKSPDFFHTDEHPRLTFESTRIVAADAAADEYDVTGQLTMLGRTRPIQFVATTAISADGLTLSSQFTIDRTKFGMDYGPGEIQDTVGLSITVGAGSPGGPATQEP